MALVVISIDRDKLPPHTQEEFEAWVRFCVGDTGGIANSNPLCDMDMESRVVEFSR